MSIKDVHITKQVGTLGYEPLSSPLILFCLVLHALNFREASPLFNNSFICIRTAQVYEGKLGTRAAIIYMFEKNQVATMLKLQEELGLMRYLAKCNSLVRVLGTWLRRVLVCVCMRVLARMCSGRC